MRRLHTLGDCKPSDMPDTTYAYGLSGGQASALGQGIARQSHHHAAGMKLRTSQANQRRGKSLCGQGTPHNVNSVHQTPGVGLRCGPPRGGILLGRAARGSVAPRKMACPPVRGASLRIYGFQGHQRAHRQGAARSLPLSIGSGNGRQENTRPCFARRVVALLRRLSLGGGSRRFHLGLCRAQCRCRSRRRGVEASALTYTGKSPSRHRGKREPDDRARAD
jgi:hypothetical protein